MDGLNVTANAGMLRSPTMTRRLSQQAKTPRRKRRSSSYKSGAKIYKKPREREYSTVLYIDSAEYITVLYSNTEIQSTV